MLVTEQEIMDVKKFIFHLNSLAKIPIVVEGKKDSAALKKLGYSGDIIEFHRFGGFVKFADYAEKFDKVIILFDRDRKGRYMTGKAIQLLQRRTKIDLSFKRRLTSITKGKIIFIEQLVCYAPYLV